MYRGLSTRLQDSLAFHLSSDHQRVEADYTCDLTRACQLYAEYRAASRRGG